MRSCRGVDKWRRLYWRNRTGSSPIKWGRLGGGAKGWELSHVLPHPSLPPFLGGRGRGCPGWQRGITACCSTWHKGTMLQHSFCHQRGIAVPHSRHSFGSSFSSRKCLPDAACGASGTVGGVANWIPPRINCWKVPVFTTPPIRPNSRL